MSWFRRNNNNTKPDYTALQLQTSVSTLPIPLLWGRNKLAGNVVWYGGFRAVPGSSGGGKGGGGKGGAGGSASTASWTYTADLIIALCEGPISSVPLVWKDQSICAPFYLGFGIWDGVTPQAAWPYITALYPGQDLGYNGTAYAAAANYNLGSSATIGNINFEIIGAFAGTGANGEDADPALVINDFLTNAQYGAGFNPASIDASTLFGSGGDSSLQTYCKAMGIAFSPVLVSQEQGSATLTRWLQIVNCGAVWSAGLLRFIPYGDSAVSAGQQTTYQQQFSIPRPVPASSGYAVPAAVTMCSPAQFVSDGGVIYAATRVPFAFIGSGLPSIAGTYGMSPTGTYVFAPPDEGAAVVVTFTGAASTSFVPNLTPVYAPDRSGFRRRERQQGSGPRRARRRLLAADDPARRSFEPVKPLFSGPGRGARPKPNRDLRAARRLGGPGARDLRRACDRADRRADDFAARALRADEIRVQTVLGVLPSRPDGHRHHHRRQPWALQLSGARYLDRGGR